ncbi:hypothetical protein ABR737_09015 [Streptomyces sp. Edi2]|uniref:hypothetical protein n=1 Tax=Streptomyces sp. Edi2 TaxID=3162528 RepID=UPI0033064557
MGVLPASGTRAKSWRAQAEDMREVAHDLRHGAGQLARQWTEPLKRYAESETGQRSLLGDGAQAPAAYHVDRRGLDPSSVEATFG